MSACTMVVLASSFSEGKELKLDANPASTRSDQEVATFGKLKSTAMAIVCGMTTRPDRVPEYARWLENLCTEHMPNARVRRGSWLC